MKLQEVEIVFQEGSVILSEEEFAICARQHGWKGIDLFDTVAIANKDYKFLGDNEFIRVLKR